MEWNNLTKQPETQKRRRVRNEIIKISAPVFTKYGYRKTTLEDLAEALNRTKSSVYYYFNGKWEIFQAVVIREGSMFRRSVINAINKEEDPISKLKTYVLTRMNTLNIYKNFHSALLDDTLADKIFIKRLKKLYDKEEKRLFKNILQEGLEKGYFKINDIDMATVAIVTAMRGIDAMLMNVEDKKEFASKIDDVINIIFYGIVKK